MDGEALSFGDFRLDLGRRELTRNGAPVRLKGRALDVLCVLAAAGGEIVTKDALMARVWPNVVVEENNLQVQISALRRALDEGKNGESFLVTVPSRGYRLVGIAAPGGRCGPAPAGQGPAVPDKPSIAVLPFTNMSGDPEQDYFADGIVEDIITALSRMRWLFVIARNSSFTYKGRGVDIKQVGAELGVRYVLEGSVRKAANRVRITGQLIDASNGAHLWADRFDGALDDIFDLQDQVTARVVGAIAPKLEQAEIERAKRKPTGSLDAYDCFLRGIACLASDVEGDDERSAAVLRPGDRARRRIRLALWRGRLLLRGAQAERLAARTVPISRRPTASPRWRRNSARTTRWHSHSPGSRSVTWSAIPIARSC